MGRYLLRRLINHVALVLIAASLTYFLAAISLNPRANFAGRNPPVAASSVTATLNDYNLNPDTPVVVRFARWANGVAHGDLGRTVTGGEVNDEFARRVGVSTRLLLIATVLGSIGGVLVGYQRPDIYAVKENLVNIGAFGFQDLRYENIGYLK
ncbi:hypothetical protein [Actinacidiphila glaucinigra]|uniref:hypothetical protein n=1 Tax=Actinacidiphila glaucinigra TaxID=235986 RepID=UPI00380942F9